jgi:hypothetical protein
VTTFVAYWIDNAARRGTPSLRRSLPFAAAKEARQWAKAKVDGGLATLATVWAFDAPDGPGQRCAVYPEWADKVVRHYLDMAAHARAGPPPTNKGG